jgi:hypothetical protein
MFSNAIYADSELFLKDRPASYCSIYTNTAATILSERLDGVSKQNSIEKNQSFGMSKRYNDDVVFLANNIYASSYDVSDFNLKDNYNSQAEKYASFAISVFEKCLFDKYGIDPWDEYKAKN